MKRLFKDKRGMTLTELLVALTLLMIVIVGTTPVMLSSYDGLYQAGEKTQQSYNAKSEIEDTLATRNSLNIVENFKVNFEGLGEVASINGKRAVSSLENSLETVFAGGRAYVTIVSSKVINDDKLAHDVILQTTNISFTDTTDISYNSPENVLAKTKSVDVSLYLPDKSTNTLASIYATRANTAEKGIVVESANPATGRIYVKVKGVDFTNSPAKIEVTYRDENDKVRKTSCYLTIKTPTIMAVGSTTYGDYYTTAGVETVKNPDGSMYDKLEVVPRRMDIAGTKPNYTKAIPSGTVFKSVNWIVEQTATTGEYADTAYEPSYYVLTGTNGAIYRTYSFKEYNTTFVGKVNLSISKDDVNGFTQKFHPLISQSGQDVLGIADSIFTLDDAKSTIVYPAVWGGDFSHVYAYSTYEDEMGYYDSNTWYTQDGSTSGKGQPGFYSNFANYAYYYNGWGMDFSFYTQNSRKISYVLTEMPKALRVAGYMEDVGDFDYGLNRMWERPGYEKTDGSWESQKEDDRSKSTMDAWWYYKGDESFARCAAVQVSNTGDNFTDKYLNELPVYFADYNGGSKLRGDNGFANIRVKALTTYSPTFIYNRLNVDGDDDDAASDVKWAYNTSANNTKVVVTDSVYLPSTSTTSGGVFYVGTVAAYGFVQQVDNIGTSDSDPDAGRIRNNGSDNTGSPSGYWIMGNDEGTSTTIYKYSFTDKTYDHSGIRANLMTKSILSGDGVKANSADSHNFFVNRTGGTVASKLFNDVLFTMGFSSNREMVYSKIVYGADKYGNIKEQHKFCEPYYFLSHYDDLTDTHVPNLYQNGTAATNDPDRDSFTSTNVTDAYLNAVDNDYYNVWFPGEMYNLTKVATKDGVTVSVGYAVAGSAYSYLNTAQNASTGLGSVYNDGVLAAMVLGKDSSFTNLLYFKDNATMDKTSISGTVTSKNYKTMIGIDYGTHARDSVQFTAVDISVESVLSGTNEVSTYYAYYADNKGRLYKSKVATKTTSKTATTNSTPQLVSHIADEPYDGTRSAPSYMEEIKVNGQSLGAYFSKITTVSCDGDYIIVGGHSNTGNFNLVIGKITYNTDTDGNPVSTSVTWKYGKIGGAAAYQLEDALILEGYVYLAGVSVANPSLHQGFICALPLETTSAITNGGDLPFDARLFVGDGDLKDRIYAIDGHKS